MKELDELIPRNLKEGIGSLFDPAVLTLGAAAILTVMFGGEALYLRVWCYHSARSAQIIIAAGSTTW